jgi:hypothetical protein
MTKNTGISENEKLWQQLQQDVQKSRKKLADVQEQFKVYIINPDASEDHLDFAGIDELGNKVRQEKHWQEKLNKFYQIKGRVSHFEQSYHKARDQLLNADAPTKQDEDNFEIATRQYHKMLDVWHTCLGNVTDSLGENGRLSKDTFPKRLELGRQEHTKWRDELEKFNTDLADVSNKIADKQFKNPANKMTVNLKAAIENLSTTYESSYDTYGKKGSFWRWIKEVFKKSDRVKEIHFLQVVSESHGCTDSIRHQALTLVCDKIKQNERFGKTSQLEKILISLTTTSLVVSKDDASNLTGFLASDPTIKASMPAKLSAFFDKNQDEYSKPYQAEEEANSFVY